VRILYSHYLPTINQPAGHMVHAIAHELRKQGHEVVIHASVKQGTPAFSPGGQAEKRFATLRSRLWFAKALLRDRARRQRDEDAVREIRPDVILVRQDAYCTSMTRAGYRLGIPVVTYADAPVACEARQRNYSQRWHPPGLVEAIERWGLRRSRAVVAVSGPGADTLRGYGLSVPIHAIPNGVNPALFPTITGARRVTARTALGLTAPCVIGFQGTFQAFHGIDLLLELMRSTAGRSDTQWLLIGDGPEREALQRATHGRVPAIFLGRRPSEEVGELLGLVDIAVAPYSPVEGPFYGCPLKVLEYAAARCAILASDLGDTRSLLDDGRAGTVLPADQPTLWIAALAHLLDNPRERGEHGRKARDWVLGSLTWAHTARRVAEVLATAIETNSSSTSPPRSRVGSLSGMPLTAVPVLQASVESHV